ncbi:MAG: hypothetical protein WAT74_17075 [Flavobacteriales bacterium]
MEKHKGHEADRASIHSTAKPGPTERSGVNPVLGTEGDLKALRKWGLRLFWEKPLDERPVRHARWP